MTDDLITWLRAQLAEDERIAQLARGAEWRDGCPVHALRKVGHEKGGCWIVEHLPATGNLIVVGALDGDPKGSGLLRETDAQHMITHDPARVLREIEAKRLIIAEVEILTGSSDLGRQAIGEDIAHAMALSYADRPGYRDEWRP